MRSPKLILIAALFTLPFAACGDDHDEDETTLDWVAEPPATATAGTAFTAMYEIHTHGDLHHTEIRLCEGADVANCGLGDASSFDVNAAATKMGDHYHAEITIDAAGMWTVAAFAHVGEDPHISATMTVDVQ